MSLYVIIFIVGMCIFSYSTFAEKWPKGAKLAYIERCTETLVSQGMPKNLANNYSQCIADGMEGEFSREEFTEMMKSQPNPKGNEIEQKLYRVLKTCSDILPK